MQLLERARSISSLYMFFMFLVTVYKVTKYLDYNKDFYREFEKISQNHEDWAFWIALLFQYQIKVIG